MQVCRGWQDVLCLALEETIAVRRVRAANAPEQSVHQMEAVSVVDETWKQRCCLSKEAKESSVKNKVMLFSPSSLLCSAEDTE